jgi:hypothetical protein
MGEGRFLLEGEEISCCSRVGIHKQLPSPHIIPSNVFVDDKVVVFPVRRLLKQAVASCTNHDAFACSA